MDCMSNNNGGLSIGVIGYNYVSLMLSYVAIKVHSAEKLHTSIEQAHYIDGSS